MTDTELLNFLESNKAQIFYVEGRTDKGETSKWNVFGRSFGCISDLDLRSCIEKARAKLEEKQNKKV